MNIKEYFSTLNETREFVELYNVRSGEPKDFAKMPFREPRKVSKDILGIVKAQAFGKDVDASVASVASVEQEISKRLMPHFVVKNGKYKERSSGDVLEFDLYVSNKPAGDFWDANKRTDYKIKITF